MIVKNKINILGLMSPKRQLIILRGEKKKKERKKNVRRLYSEAKLPYLNIYRMIILPVDEFMILLVWALHADVCAINASNDTWSRSHGVEPLLLATCFRLRWHPDPAPHTKHECISHRSDGTACC